MKKAASVNIIIISHDSSPLVVMMMVLPREEWKNTQKTYFRGREGFALNENIFCGSPSIPEHSSCLYTTKAEYFMHVLADLNYANGKRAAIKVIIKL